MKYTKAKQIFKDCFLFHSMSELNQAIVDDKRKVTKHNWGGTKNHVVGAGCNTILICHPEGGRMPRLDEPIGTRVTITKNDILSAIDAVIAEYGDDLPSFDLCSDAQLYWYETIRDKVMGVEAEPTSEYYGVTILSYKQTV